MSSDGSHSERSDRYSSKEHPAFMIAGRVTLSNASGIVLRDVCRLLLDLKAVLETAPCHLPAHLLSRLTALEAVTQAAPFSIV